MNRTVHYLYGYDRDRPLWVSRLVPLCGNAAQRRVGEDGYTLRWEAVNCRGCREKGPDAAGGAEGEDGPGP